MGLLTELPEAVRKSAIEMVEDEPNETLIGYTAVTGPHPTDMGRVVPIAWNIVTNSGVYEIQPNGVVVRAKALHPFL